MESLELVKKSLVQDPITIHSEIVVQNMPLSARYLGARKQNAHPENGRFWTVDLLFPKHLSGTADINPIAEEEADFLYGLVRALKPRVVFETGTHKGRSTRAIASALAAQGFGKLYTLDMEDYKIFESGALREWEKPYVTQLIGKSPEILQEIEVKDIEFAFLDGAHTADVLECELLFVEARRKEPCYVLVENADDNMWFGIREYFKGYQRWPKLPLATMCGMMLIIMQGEPNYTVLKQQEDHNGQKQEVALESSHEEIR